MELRALGLRCRCAHGIYQRPVSSLPVKQPWTEIEPKDAKEISLPHPEIYGPLTQEGEECPWPWDPPQLKGAPLGMYHCPYCGEMVLAGLPHVDYRDEFAGIARNPQMEDPQTP